jgi:hypothetical protein
MSNPTNIYPFYGIGKLKFTLDAHFKESKKEIAFFGHKITLLITFVENIQNQNKI